ncbi:MAG: hypothetical protein HC841_05505 [Verrucomicrobiae bacterium]|nr:hypothetical protein [Verrucomicrobiae bacterium]
MRTASTRRDPDDKAETVVTIAIVEAVGGIDLVAVGHHVHPENPLVVEVGHDRPEHKMKRRPGKGISRRYLGQRDLHRRTTRFRTVVDGTLPRQAQADLAQIVGRWQFRGRQQTVFELEPGDRVYVLVGRLTENGTGRERQAHAKRKRPKRDQDQPYY